MRLFQDIKAGRVAGEIGNKARNLRRLHQHGFRILPTYVLSAETVKRLFLRRSKRTGELLFTARHAGRFLPQLYGLFPADIPFIVRSSAKEEDKDASFAGIYESVMVPQREHVMDAIRKCIRSTRGRRPAAYRRLIGRSRPSGMGLALVFEPFVEADFGGVARFDHQERIVIEMSRKGNAGITGGRAADLRFMVDIKRKRFDRPDAGIVPSGALRKISSRIMELKQKLFPGRSMSVEFLLKGEDLIFLQARPVSEKNEGESVDMAGIYHGIRRLMDGLRAGEDEWSLMESVDVAAFNYLQAARRLDERLEHFRIRISPAAKRRISGKGWLNVKYDDDDDIVFPSRLAPGAQKLIDALAQDNIFVMFVLPRKGEDIICKTLDIKHGRNVFSMPFSYSFEGMEKADEKDMSRYSPEEAVGYLGRLDRERAIWLAIKEKLKTAGTVMYDRRLSGYLRKELELIDRKKRMIGKVIGRKPRATKEVRGIPFKPQDMVITGTAVTYKNVALARERSFVYFGYDLEPCFVSYMRRIKAVVVSRGAFGSHAAQLCREFGVPLVIETAHLNRVKDGDRVSLNLRSGVVNEIKRPSRPARLRKN